MLNNPLFLPGQSSKELVREDQYFIQPYNRRNCEPDRDHLAADEHLAAVTAAALLVEADKYHQVGGFDQQYIYGYEDVDLCLKLDEAGFRNIYCPHCILFHYEFGTQQEDNKEEVYQRRLRNFKIFRARWQDYLSARLAEDKKKGSHVYTDQPLLNNPLFLPGQSSITSCILLQCQHNI